MVHLTYSLEDLIQTFAIKQLRSIQAIGQAHVGLLMLALA